MSDNVLPFQRKKRRQQKAAHKTLCRSGRHAWQVDKTQRFDVRSGKLVTVERCRHCDLTRNKLT